MRVTALDNSSPLYYHLYNNLASYPAFGATAVASILSTSHNVFVYTKPTIDIGGAPFPSLLTMDRLRLSMIASANSSATAVGQSSVCYGYFMEPPPDDADFIYRISGNIYSPTQLLVNSLHLSIGVGHNTSNNDGITNNIGTNIENYICSTIHEHHLSYNTVSTGFHIPNQNFNFSLYDSTIPPNEDSRIFFYLIIRNVGSANSSVPPIVANINVWRQYAPLKMYNQWEA